MLLEVYCSLLNLKN